MKELHRNLDKFNNVVLDDHKAKREADKNFVPRDMVDVLLQQAEDPNLEVKLNTASVKGLMQVCLSFSLFILLIIDVFGRELYDVSLVKIFSLKK